MSLAELTRNCFQSGISSSKWLGLCKLLISKEPTVHGPDVEPNLSNSVLVLYRFYPGDPDLQDYLKCAIQDGLLSVAVFVATLLQAARSPELHAPATLDTLCRIALDAHYSSGLSPIGSVVPYAESPITVLGTVQDALALLRTARTLPTSHFHQLTASASELVILLLSCVSDISQVSTAQAMVHFADANDLLQNFDLGSDVRQVLETFVLSLSLLIGDDAKAAREAQIMHTIQLALGKGDILGPGSNTDNIVTFSLVLNQLVSYRAHNFGSGDKDGPVALFVGLFRWASWAPVVFYTQLFLAAFTCLSQSSKNTLIWKAFIVGRLPRILTLFESGVNADGVTKSEWRRAIQEALMTAFQRSELILQCDHALARARGHGATQNDEKRYSSRSFLRDLLQEMIHLDLIALPLALEIDPLISNDNTPRLRDEAQDSGLDLDSYLESKLMPDLNATDLSSCIDRVWRDAGSHSVFTEVILKRFGSLANTFDVESLSHLCKILYTHDSILDMMAIHVKLSDIVVQALLFLEQYECETVGDPQTAVSHLGDVVLFVQYITARFHLEAVEFDGEIRPIFGNFLNSTDAVHPIEVLSEEDAIAFNSWFKALFDSSSEGIEDNILRSIRPRTLLRMSATLFSNAIKASLLQKIDIDVLNNGVSYFTGPLLNWTLVGVVKALVREIQQKGFNAPTHFDILQTLLLSPSCPRPVLALCGPRILLLLGDKKGKTRIPAPGFDVASVKQVIAGTIGMEFAGETPPRGTHVTWEDEPKQAISTALTLARLERAPALDVERCIRIIPPSKFLQLMWSELVIAASQGQMENCCRIATFVMTTPRSSNAPPLLPIFLHYVSPSVISAIDQQQAPEHTVNLELLVTVISSVLTAALHLELALRSVIKDNRYVLGQPSAAMARGFAAELRARRNSHAARMIGQRLASSQTFVANFPAFMGEL